VTDGPNNDGLPGILNEVAVHNTPPSSRIRTVTG
jgi:hypothetical protein